VRILLDTHAFLWWESNASLLSEAAFAACQSPDNVLLLSIASLWEIQIKSQLGKLMLTEPLKVKIQRQKEVNGLVVFPIEEEHIYTLNRLEAHHRDPFDRILIAQAIAEDTPIVTQDPLIVQYGTNIVK
jgi:PIN domain nuclease of toxin-antitoxin system